VVTAVVEMEGLGIQVLVTGAMMVRVMAPTIIVGRWSIGPRNVDPRQRKRRLMWPKMMNPHYCLLRSSLSRQRRSHHHHRRSSCRHIPQVKLCCGCPLRRNRLQHVPLAVHIGWLFTWWRRRWVLDTCTTNHMMGSRSAFFELDRSIHGTVKFGDGSVV
jgi:hypothetical protein